MVIPDIKYLNTYILVGKELLPQVPLPNSPFPSCPSSPTPMVQEPEALRPDRAGSLTSLCRHLAICLVGSSHSHVNAFNPLGQQP